MMNTVQIGNGYYILYIEFAAVYLLLLLLSLRKRSEKTMRIVFLVLLFSNLAMHFLKQLFPPYREGFPYTLRSSALQNICAVSTVFFPFIYLKKKQTVLHDYAYFIGMCGGLGALAFPTETLGNPPFAPDTIRFYFCHTTLIVVPLAAAILGLYRPRLKKFWAIPLLFLAHQTIICLDEFFLIGVGAVPGATFSDLLDPGFRNSSFTFGVRPDFAGAAFLFDPLVPSFFKTDAFHLNGGKPFYFPVLWLIIPTFCYLIPVYLLFSLPFAFSPSNPSSK